MMLFMASPESPESSEPQSEERHSVLADLPHTRPQRASPRRERARGRARAAEPARQGAPAQATPATKRAPARPSGAAKASGATGSKRPAADGSRRSGAAPAKRSETTRTKQRGGRPTREPTPKQGYEADNELTGTPVSPPSGPEMLGALAELAGELAQTGVAAGSRLLRGALSRLSGS